MGQKVSPHGLRVGVIKDWDSKWYADKKNFADYLIEDNKVREYVKKKLYVAEVYAHQGPTMKRWRAGSQGRASIILKRSSHVGVTLREKE